MVSDEEKEIIREFKEKVKKYREMLHFIVPRLHNEADYLGLDSHSDEYIIRAINLSESKINKYRKLKDHEKRNMCNINAVFHNVGTRINNLEESVALKKEKLYEIRDYIDNYQDYFPEIRSPLANCPKQPIKKYKYRNEELHHLTRIQELSRVNWGVEIKKIQERKKRMEENERREKNFVYIPHNKETWVDKWKKKWNRRKRFRKRMRMNKKLKKKNNITRFGI